MRVGKVVCTNMVATKIRKVKYAGDEVTEKQVEDFDDLIKKGFLVEVKKEDKAAEAKVDTKKAPGAKK